MLSARRERGSGITRAWTAPLAYRLALRQGVCARCYWSFKENSVYPLRCKLG